MGRRGIWRELGLLMFSLFLGGRRRACEVATMNQPLAGVYCAGMGSIEDEHLMLEAFAGER